jgi:hypothetical protein
MKTVLAQEAKNDFAELVLIEKHGPGGVMVVSMEEYQRLSVQPERIAKDAEKDNGAATGGQRSFRAR